jgi:spermidine/putrescine transport system substrate-binding protein
MKHPIRILFTLLLSFFILGSIQLISNFSPTSKKNELHISVYNDYLDLDMIDAFTKETGIKVHLHFFNSNEELITKIQFSKGEGLDLLIPSDYTCKILADKGVLQPIDRSKLDFLDRIYPFLLNKDFDKGNNYSIPYTWEAYGILFDPNQLQMKEFTINDYFNPSFQKVMTGDLIEATSIASYTLYKDKRDLSEGEIEELTSFLKTQNKSVRAYADFRGKDIVASTSAAYGMVKTSFLDAIHRENPHLKFSLTKDTFFTSIENVVILKKSKNLDQIYTFLNYIYKAENLALTANLFPCYPACEDTFAHPNNHCDLYFDTIEEIKLRPLQMQLFYYCSDPEKVRNMFIKSKV